LANSENLGLRLNGPLSSSIIVGIVYRHPNKSNTDKFITDLSNCLDTFKEKNDFLHFGRFKY